MGLREATPDEIAAGSGPLVVDPTPQDDWYTAETLVGLGYKPEVLEELFGAPTAGPEGLTGWTVSSVHKIEQTVIAPAARLVGRIFADDEAAADLLERVNRSW